MSTVFTYNQKFVNNQSESITKKQLLIDSDWLSTTSGFWVETVDIVLGYCIPRQCFKIGYTSAMYSESVHLDNVLTKDIPRQCNKTGFTLTLY